MEKQYVYYQTVLQFRQEIGEDGKLGPPQTMRSWTTQISGQGSIPLASQPWRKKKATAEKKEAETQQKINDMKTTIADTVYD